MKWMKGLAGWAATVCSAMCVVLGVMLIWTLVTSGAYSHGLNSPTLVSWSMFIFGSLGLFGGRV